MKIVKKGKYKFIEGYFDWFILFKYTDNQLEEIVSIECVNL